ncbi:hypothetical protein EBH_0064560 [Eimeria brunetti]|uniref:Uncharacterized protein n=1 Tax=Eimeria brunetti TaxID=51314 RepID=U6LAC2_9EIME|nr:hypothetical protein EBH_0064560 [Eimeria brunetti]
MKGDRRKVGGNSRRQKETKGDSRRQRGPPSTGVSIHPEKQRLKDLFHPRGQGGDFEEFVGKETELSLCLPGVEEGQKKAGNRHPTTPGIDPTDPGIDPGIDPTTPGIDPTDAGIDPTGAGIDPTDAGIDPTTPGIDPTTPGIDPTTHGIDPTDAGIDPTAPGIDPTDAGIDPTDAGIDPGIDPGICGVLLEEAAAAADNRQLQQGPLPFH